MDYLKFFDPKELDEEIDKAPEVRRFAQEYNVEEAGELLPRYAEPEREFATLPDYWMRVKKEVHRFLCTDDEAYRAIKEQISKHGDRVETVGVSILSTAIATHVSLAAGVVVPFCALLLRAAIMIGYKTYCNEWTDLSGVRLQSSDENKLLSEQKESSQPNSDTK
jgi:hypothetical protein